ncbi:MAG: NAD(P)/FAD-dependent oxidoreductase [Anaerolineae bacterium]|nr:MAG: NAD(P)/FAD-dependent oxidoreductase [Anaerolineae bacterium]
MAEEKKLQKKLLAALAVGAAFGAGIALLLSPRRGRDFRAQLREGGMSLKERVRMGRGKSVRSPSDIAEAKPPLSIKGRQADYDGVVVGGGLNGLVAAAYLARAGRKILLLERREIVGGAAVTEELIPGYRFSSLTDDSGCLPPKIVSDLDLGSHGLNFLSFDPLIFAPLPGATSLAIWEDVDRTVKEISKFSPADASSYPGFIDRMGEYCQVIAGIKNMTPPDLPGLGIRDILELRNLAKPVRGLGRKNLAQAIRVLPMSVADLLNEWFESDIVKGVIAASTVKNISLGPREAGTAYMLLYNWSESSNGLFLSNRRAAGGSGALAQAVADAAVSFGAEIKTNQEVARIITQGGQAAGVELASGEQISAALVVSAVDMRTTFLRLVDPYYLDRSFVQHVGNINYRGTMARVHFALKRLPSFTAVKSDRANLLSGRIQIAPSMTYLQKAYDPVKYGHFSQQPYLDIQIPTLIDPSLAPDGKHLMSVTAKYMPYFLRQEDWNEAGELLAQLVISTVAEYAPDFSECIEDLRVITPLDMENIYNLPEGNLTHGQMTLNQFMWMRPLPGYAQYRAPVDYLYLCSSAAHPGGAITGLNGKNAAREILKDWR